MLFSYFMFSSVPFFNQPCLLSSQEYSKTKHKAIVIFAVLFICLFL